MAKLGGPILALLAVWALVLVIATAAGVPFSTRRNIAMLVISPLWFLLPYLALRAATAPLTKVIDRAGPAAVVAPAVLLIVLTDAGLLPGWIAVIAAWSVPWVLGITVARRGRTALPATAMIAAGIATMAFLVLYLDYPASAVGVPGDGRSNLSPPSLFAVALGATQIGLYLLIARLADHRRARREVDLQIAPPPPPPRYWVGGKLRAGYDNFRGRLWTRTTRLVPSLNRASLPIYLFHQSVFVAFAGISTLIAGGETPGLVSAPTGPHWILARLAWLPFLALGLTAIIRFAWPATRATRTAPRTVG